MFWFTLRESLFTPRKRRKQFHKPVQMPSSVLHASRLRARHRRRHTAPTHAGPACGTRWHGAPIARRMEVRLPRSAVGRHGLGAAGAFFNRGLEGLPITVMAAATLRGISPLSRPTTPATGGRSLSHVPCPFTLFARHQGGSSGSSCLTPFSPAFRASARVANRLRSLRPARPSGGKCCSISF